MKTASRTKTREFDPSPIGHLKDFDPLLHDGTSDDVETEDDFLATIARHTEGAALFPPVACCEKTHRLRYR